MSVSSVKIVSVIGVMKELDSVVDFCGKTESFQPDSASSYFSDTRKFVSLAKANPYNKPLQKANDMISDINKDLKIIDTRALSLDKNQIDNYLNNFSGNVYEFIDKRDKLESKIREFKKQKSELEHFVGIDIKLNDIFACKYIKIRFGRIPKETYYKLDRYKDNPYVMFFEYTSDLTHYWGVYCVSKDHADEVDGIFSSLGFERLIVTSSDDTPDNTLENVKDKISLLESELLDVNKEIDNLWLKEKIKFTEIYSKLKEYETYYNIRNYGVKYRGNFILVGWVPKEKEDEFKQGLSKINGIDYEFDDPKDMPAHTPPTLLKNLKLFKPYEFFINMYGVPNHNEIDPTPLVAITYFMIFGIMFGDLGHGIILFVVAILMWKLKGMELGKVLIPCSITSMIWGLIFGSFFGFEHALDPVYKLLFNLNEKPIEVMSTTTTNYIIYMSTGIGVVLVALAIFINVYSSIKQGNLGRALFSHSGLFGMIFYISVICGLLLQVMMSIPVFSNAFFWIFFIVIPLLAMLFGEVLTKIVEHKPNIKPEGGWGEYIIQNFFELFEAILSYMTNTVSFLRIGAYVLVHSGMLLVVFTLSAMVPENSAVYWLIVVLGNVFVIGLEALLVGIQVLRLEFYEIFNRFYQGDGVPFKPVAVSKN